MLPCARRSPACCLRTPLLLLMLWLPLLAALWPQVAVAAIQDLRVGDQVLALAEWKEPGEAKSHEGKRLDARLSYEKVLDIVTSHREQTLVHLSLSNGDKLTATEGHPFKTTDGWRDAILLKKGGKLLLRAKGDEPPGVRVADSDGVFPERVATITEIRIERLTVPVYNLEVANAHTFYVGADGALVHNAKYCGSYKEYNKGDNWAKRVFDRLTGGNSTSPRPGTMVGKDKLGRPVNYHESSTQPGRPTVEMGGGKNPVAKHRY